MFLLLTVIPLAKLWKVIFKYCVESLRQAHEVIHEAGLLVLHTFRAAFYFRDDRFHSQITEFPRNNTFELINVLLAFHR